jgi:hypothetical protein
MVLVAVLSDAANQQFQLDVHFTSSDSTSLSALQIYRLLLLSMYE